MEAAKLATPLDESDTPPMLETEVDRGAALANSGFPLDWQSSVPPQPSRLASLLRTLRILSGFR